MLLKSSVCHISLGWLDSSCVSTSCIIILTLGNFKIVAIQNPWINNHSDILLVNSPNFFHTHHRHTLQITSYGDQSNPILRCFPIKRERDFYSWILLESVWMTVKNRLPKVCGIGNWKLKARETCFNLVFSGKNTSIHVQFKLECRAIWFKPQEIPV